MVLIPAWVWRGGPVFRAVCLGVPAGVLMAALAFAESGVLLSAPVVFVVISLCNGVMMARRMGKAWPAAIDLSADERVAVSSAARRGHPLAEVRLAPAAIEYVGALRDAGVQARRFQWILRVGGVAVLVLAVIDSAFATPRVAAVSWLIVGLFAIEIFWWPRVRARLLDNAERTRESACRALSQRQVDDA
ncbi:hypothetical protein A5787_17195 [Mycobacterium sp. 852002-50816_SCH5313054-b]|uniref:hypothetical protein n=1 Tax=Mycobacterium sp. 852002-50816_SCH5313054-b TaxID=1834092 RepID=UPI000800B236|nr:hypothetical protein [Mycobacterium sp. 852002-50816_SCH5313054-b]OBF62090.1 hypothetical protein A5787_17195 [Mycobacterium sp. 852002-50816_SCH5313054-b]